MQFARRFCIVALCALGVLVGAASAQAQPNKLLPNDTEMIVTINLQQILKSEAVTANKALLDVVKAKMTEELDKKDLSKYFKMADFDVFRDLGSITVAVPGGRNPQESFMVLTGNFDLEKIKDAATDASKQAGGGLKVVKLAGIEAFEVSPEGEKTIYIGVLSKKMMVAAATKADFTDAVARFNGTKETKLKAEVKSLTDTINAKQSLSVVATSGIIAKLSENAPQGGGDQAKKIAEAMKAIDGFSAALTVLKDINFQAGIATKDAETANQYSLLANFFIGTIKSKVADEAKKNAQIAPAIDVVNSLKASTQGNNLVIRGQISFETLGQILQNLPMKN